jgi:DNA-binding MarR family transcriptional regulator
MKNKELDRSEDMTLNVLSAVEADSKVTQRSLAEELGIALGLTNSYLKKCIDKGLIKIKQVPANRYSYYLTASGFSEKTRLTAKYFKTSFNFYRKAKEECSIILKNSLMQGKTKIILSDYSEFAEIASIVALNSNIKILGIIGLVTNNTINIPIKKDISMFGEFDSIIITNMEDMHSRYNELVKIVTKSKIIVPKILGGNDRSFF